MKITKTKAVKQTKEQSAFFKAICPRCNNLLKAKTRKQVKDLLHQHRLFEQVEKTSWVNLRYLETKFVGWCK